MMLRVNSSEPVILIINIYLFFSLYVQKENFDDIENGVFVRKLQTLTDRH
jgi:hypothetical protein